MCSAISNLVTSLEFQPKRCGIMLCHYGRTRNGYVFTRFIPLGSTAESTATGGYVVVPERFGQSEARAAKNMERTRKKLSFVPSSGFNRCKWQPHVNMNFTHRFYIHDFMFLFISFLLWKT